MREIDSSEGRDSKLVCVAQSEGFDEKLAIPGYVSLSDDHSEAAKTAFRELQTLWRDDTWGSLEDDELRRAVFERVIPDCDVVSVMRCAARRAIGFARNGDSSDSGPALLMQMKPQQIRRIQRELRFTEFEIEDWADSQIVHYLLGRPPLDSRLSDSLVIESRKIDR